MTDLQRISETRDCGAISRSGVLTTYIHHVKATMSYCEAVINISLDHPGLARLRMIFRLNMGLSKAALVTLAFGTSTPTDACALHATVLTSCFCPFTDQR